jgi:hypothetical protein
MQPMTAWSAQELDRIGQAEELEIASRRPDGSLRSFVTIWMVRVDDGLFVRSAHGQENPWFRRAVESGEGRVRAGGVERDVTFEAGDPTLAAAITAAFAAKYGHYHQSIVDPVISPESEGATLRLVAR